MAINYAAKYSEKIDERFALMSVTAPAVNDDFDFIGVKTVNVYSIPTKALNDYSMTGNSRYGRHQRLAGRRPRLLRRICTCIQS